jgi:D-proline reductase (dithiol) PrdB
VSALAHFIEDEGIATTGISLVREHTAGYRPPRFLWVPFPLGRPFGPPGAQAFQRRVLLAALALLVREDGPVVLEDFPDDPPAGTAPGTDDAWACPVSFPAPPPDPSDLASAVAAEVAALAPWYALARERRGRTVVGLTGQQPDTVAAYLAGFLHATPAPLRPERSAGENVKLACEDLKAFYAEGATARPGPVDAGALADWFWGETAAGRLMLALEDVLATHPDQSLRLVASDYLVPRTQAHRTAGRDA